MRPTARLLLSHPAHFIALGFGAGLSPWAPGTAGTLLAWILYPLIRTPLSEFVFLALLASLFIAGVLAAERTGRTLGVPDHGGIVWDEMVEVWPLTVVDTVEMLLARAPSAVTRAVCSLEINAARSLTSVVSSASMFVICVARAPSALARTVCSVTIAAFRSAISVSKSAVSVVMRVASASSCVERA